MIAQRGLWPVPPALAAAVAGSALLAGCGAGPPAGARTEPDATARRASAPRAPGLCAAPLRVRVTGRVRAPAAAELSGLARSPSRPGVLWTHNDSGDAARLLAVTAAGRTVAEVSVSGAENVDWEDIATGPGGSLLVGDVGDNLAARPHVVVYRVPERRASGVAVAARHVLRYPDGARDAEALLFDDASATIVIVSKSFGGDARIYVTRLPSPRQVATLRHAGTLALGAGAAVTAGDVSADGGTIALRTYDRALIWRRRAGEAVAAALRRRPCVAQADLLREGQGEALALSRDGHALLTVGEGRRPALRRYEQRANAP